MILGYKPTLGGIKKAQNFLEENGYPMPNFRMEIYDFDEWIKVDAKGRIIPIEEAIRKYGAITEVANVEIRGGFKFIRFNQTYFWMIFSGDSTVEFSPGDPTDYDFRDFICGNRRKFLNLARYGKMSPSILDRIRFFLLPKRYANEML